MTVILISTKIGKGPSTACVMFLRRPLKCVSRRVAFGTRCVQSSVSDVGVLYYTRTSRLLQHTTGSPGLGAPADTVEQREATSRLLTTTQAGSVHARIGRVTWKGVAMT